MRMRESSITFEEGSQDEVLEFFALLLSVGHLQLIVLLMQTVLYVCEDTARLLSCVFPTNNDISENETSIIPSNYF